MFVTVWFIIGSVKEPSLSLMLLSWPFIVALSQAGSVVRITCRVDMFFMCGAFAHGAIFLVRDSGVGGSAIGFLVANRSKLRLPIPRA